MADDDRDRAEREYATKRLAEIMAELRRNEAELGFALNEETAQQIVADVLSALQNAGKADLAVKYQAALRRVESAIEHHRRLLEQDADDQAVSAARDRQDDAIEELQRVGAEVDAFFEKGGV